MATWAKKLNQGLDLSSKLAVVAGGSQGIGRGVCLRLAQAGSGVIVIGRNESRLAAVIEECKRNAPSGSKGQVYEYISADLSRVSSFKKALEDIKTKSKGSVDYLFQTQGGPPMYNYDLTEEGIEKLFAIQVLSRFALNEGLASQGILKTASVNIASPGSKASEFDVEDCESRSSRNKNAISLIMAKARDQGVMTDAATLALQSKYPSIRFYHIFPGIVTTQSASNAGFPFPLPQLFSLASPIISRTIGNSPESFADLPVLLAANESAEKVDKVDTQQGRFLTNLAKKVAVSEWGQKVENQEKAYQKLKSYLA